MDHIEALLMWLWGCLGRWLGRFPRNPWRLRRGGHPLQGARVLAPLNFDFLVLTVASGGNVSGIRATGVWDLREERRSLGAAAERPPRRKLGAYLGRI
jgi:hypothetical protein